MALYQFYLEVVPKDGLITRFGEIPNRIDTNLEKETEYLPNVITEDEKPLKSIIEECWKYSKSSPQEIIHLIDQLLPRANWGNDKNFNKGKYETEAIDNDASILISDNQDKFVYFYFGGDLREPSLKFINEMITICAKFDFMLFDRKGNLSMPKIEKIAEIIKKSNSFKFINNPMKFLTDLDEGNIQIE